MTTSAPTITFDNSTDALFRAWGQAIDTAMLAVGWTAASDAGQIDFTTVLKPSGATQSRGYKLYQSNDGGTPFYFKIEFGSNGFGALGPAVFISTGWLTDGAGNFKGLQKGSRYEIRIASANAASNAAMTSYFCYSDGAFTWHQNEGNVSSNSGRHVIGLDRYRNASGTALNTGIWLGACNINSGNIIVRDGAGSPFNSEVLQADLGPGWGAFGGWVIGLEYSSPSASWSRGGVKGAGVIKPWDAGCLPPTIAWILGSSTDTAVAATDTCSLYGTSRTYRMTSTANRASGSSIAVLYQ